MQAPSPPEQPIAGSNSCPDKVCFVTVGATAGFPKLITEVLSEPFMQALLDAGYTKLNIQYGKDGETIFKDALSAVGELVNPKGTKLEVSGFDFKIDGLVPDMKAVQPGNDRLAGMMVCHAGMCSFGAVGLNFGIGWLTGAVVQDRELSSRE